MYSTDPRSSQCPSTIALELPWLSRYLALFSRTVLASARSDASSKSKNASASDILTSVPSSDDGGGGGGGDSVSVCSGAGGGGGVVETLLDDEQPTAARVAAKRAASASVAMLGDRLIVGTPYSV